MPFIKEEIQIRTLPDLRDGLEVMVSTWGSTSVEGRSVLAFRGDSASRKPSEDVQPPFNTKATGRSYQVG